METTTNAKAERFNGMTEGVEYYKFKDGKGIEHRIANCDHELFAPRNYGNITLEAFRVAKNYQASERPDIETKSTFRAVKDRATGLWFGEPIGINDHDKQITWRKFPLRMMNNFDLTKADDRKQWAMLSRDGRVEGSPNQSGKPLYKVIDSAKKALDYMENVNKKKRCYEILGGLSYEQQIELSPALGINSKAYSQHELIAEFHRFADSNFQKFLELWDSPTRTIVTVLKRALTTGTVERKIIEGSNGMMQAYVYGSITLGSTESEAITWLSESRNQAMLTSILFQVKEAEKSVHQGNAKVIPPSTDGKTKALESEVDRLKAELAEAKKQQATTTQFQYSTTKVSPAATNSTENKAGEKTTPNLLEGLQAEAKALKIKGAHLTKDPEKLKQKIEEAKALATV